MIRSGEAGAVPPAIVRRGRVLLVAAMVVLAADLVVLATGAVDDPRSTTTGRAEHEEQPEVGGSPTTAPPAGSVTPDAGATSTSAVDQSVPATDSSTTASTSAAPEAASPSQPATGLWTYRVSGTASINGAPRQVPPESTLRVEQLSATDQRHTTESTDGRSVQVLRYLPDAVLLVSLDIEAAGTSFRPEPPVLYIPVPAEVGQSWSWSMTSTDGGTRIDQTSTVTRQETVTIAGSAVDTFVIQSTLTLSGEVQGTIHLESWASPIHVLPVRTHAVTDVRAGLFAARSDTTAELTALSPA